ncbi:MAG: hypothetical protein RIT28_3144 [Pseudomonadota bacterium]
MVDFPASPYRVPYDGSFRVAKAPTHVDVDGDDDDKDALRAAVARISDLQGRLYAHNRLAVLVIFQAMDAAGKDSTIRAVLSGVNPAGCQVHAFKSPSSEELDHDFLWRTTCRLPERGRIGVFNRSYYEEVLVVRVHPELLAAQSLPGDLEPERLWAERYESIRDHERHLARSGLVILKFWLNVSLEEQTRRLLRRIDDPKRNYKFESRDVTEQAHWAEYMASYELALRQTSTPWAPWYAIPADDKPKMRRLVAEHIAETMESLHLPYPELPRRSRDELDELRRALKARLKG